MEEKQAQPKRPTPVTVETQFDNSPRITFMISATGQTGNTVATNDKVRLMHGRVYKLPVNTDKDSDNYSGLKEYSNLADKILVRFVKDGMAHVVPIQNNVVIESKERLCVIW